MGCVVAFFWATTLSSVRTSTIASSGLNNRATIIKNWSCANDRNNHSGVCRTLSSEIKSDQVSEIYL